MNLEERTAFWKTLCSLNSENIKNDKIKLNQSIKFPQSLYRYRSVNIWSIDNLRHNIIHFTSADKYDDPFDTSIYFNSEKWNNSLSDEIKNPSFMNYFVRVFNENKNDALFKSLFGEAKIISLKDIINIFSDDHIGLLSKMFVGLFALLKQNIYSACFSEDGSNETLWLKYANNHKGFIQAYDLTIKENYVCGTLDQCKDCSMHLDEPTLYPIYYSEEEKYEGNDFLQYILKQRLREAYPDSSEIIDAILPMTRCYHWDPIKASLIKKICHQYDKEWRLLTFNKDNIDKMLWKPSSIILGLRMEKSEEQLVTQTAKEAGIKDIRKCYINNNGDLDTYLVE